MLHMMIKKYLDIRSSPFQIDCSTMTVIKMEVLKAKIET